MTTYDASQLPAAEDHDGLTGAFTPIEPAVIAAATRVIRKHAADADELLAMLGIEVAV